MTPEMTLLLSVLALATSSTLVQDILEKINTTIAQIPSKYKPLVQALLAYGVLKLGVLLGIPALPADVTTWTGDVVNTVLVSLGGVALHSLKKIWIPKSTPTTPVLN